MTHELEKRNAAEAAAALVEDGMIVGLGTGSTVAALLRALAARGLDIRCVATSPRTEEEARTLGLRVERFDGSDAVDRLDIAIDGADQVSPSGWLVKGGGAAHTREKVVAAAADRFLVIVSPDKVVESLAPPVPLELLPFGLAATLRELGRRPPARRGPQPGWRRARGLPGRDRRPRRALRPPVRHGRSDRARPVPALHGVGGARRQTRRRRPYRRSGGSSD